MIKDDITNYSDDNEIRKINESLQKKHSFLAQLTEKVIYDKEFLLEVQSKGYNPLDSEDVQNFIEQKPSKYQERNIILSGANKYNYLGQGEYKELELSEFFKKTGVDVNIKKPEDIYASDFKGKKRDLLMEKAPEINFSEMESTFRLNKEEDTFKNLEESEDLLRKNMAKAFGSEEIKNNEIPSSKELSIKNDSIEKTLQLIKELKALGFTKEEIKQELQLRYK